MLKVNILLFRIQKRNIWIYRSTGHTQKITEVELLEIQKIKLKTLTLT